MFELFEKVRVISQDLVGTIVDISEINGVTKYIVESDVEFEETDTNHDRFPLFYCTEEEFEKVDGSHE